MRDHPALAGELFVKIPWNSKMGRVSRKCLLGAFGDVLSKECFLLRRQFVKDKRGLRTWSVDVEETPTFLNTRFLQIKVLVRFGSKFTILLWDCCYILL